MKQLKKIITLCLTLCLAATALTACKEKPLDISGFIEVAHIVDPHTGMPYTTVYNQEAQRYENSKDHIISATVLSDSSMEGDSYATAVCVMGLDKGIQFLETRGLSGALFTADKKMAIVGSVSLYMEDEYDEFKDFELVYGSHTPLPAVTEYEYTADAYESTTEYVFAEDMSFRMNLYGTAKSAAREEMLLAVRALDAQISLTKEDSQISRLNRAKAAEAVELGAEAYALLQQAKRIYTETEGIFNVAAAPLSALWNVDIRGINRYKPYGRDTSKWDQPQSLPTLAQIEAAKADIDLDDLILTEADGKFYATKRKAGLQVDLGGIAKGYAVDLCKEICARHGLGSALMNISGNIYLYKSLIVSDKDGSRLAPWSIGITSPTDPFRLLHLDNICAFQVTGDTSVVTSGSYIRFYMYHYDK